MSDTLSDILNDLKGIFPQNNINEIFIKLDRANQSSNSKPQFFEIQSENVKLGIAYLPLSKDYLTAITINDSTNSTYINTSISDPLRKDALLTLLF